MHVFLGSCDGIHQVSGLEEDAALAQYSRGRVDHGSSLCASGSWIEFARGMARGSVFDLDFDPRSEQAVEAQAVRDNRSRNCARRQSRRNVGGSPSEKFVAVHSDDVFGRAEGG